jgi:predicted nucleic acid-binding protein
VRAYVDSSALVKRIFDEPGAETLRAAFRDGRERDVRFVTSALARVEVSRVARMRIETSRPRDVTIAASEAFLGVAITDLTRPILESARVIGPPNLRSLDAIHVATAIGLGVDELWTYDHRMAQVAEELGIRVRMPA